MKQGLRVGLCVRHQFSNNVGYVCAAPETWWDHRSTDPFVSSTGWVLVQKWTKGAGRTRLAKPQLRMWALTNLVRASRVDHGLPLQQKERRLRRVTVRGVRAGKIVRNAVSGCVGEICRPPRRDMSLARMARGDYVYVRKLTRCDGTNEARPYLVIWDLHNLRTAS